MSRTKFFWFVAGDYDLRGFDFRWVPHWSQNTQTHIFQCYSQFGETFSVIFAPKHDHAHVENWHDRKYLRRKPHNEYWVKLVDNVEWNAIEWSPNPYDPPFIYVFGNQWHDAQSMPTIEYRVPGATERKYVDDIRATLLPCMDNWAVPEEVDASKIDFSWVPDPGAPPYVYHFSTEFQMSVGLTYTVPGASDPHFGTDIPTKGKVKATQTLDIFFVDKNNKTANARFEALQARYPTAQKIRFMNGWVETIKRCVTRTNTTKFWVISSENVYDEFNFEWHAQPWQSFMLHIFGSQWQKWSDTFLINKAEFMRHAKWAKSLEEFPNLNFVHDQPVYRPDDLYDIYFVDHSNIGSKEQLEKVQKRYPQAKTARFVDNYLDTLKRVVSAAETEYVWVINSICDYSKFDFTWQPDPWQAKMLHVFPSNDQKFGDTFYVHVPTFKEQMNRISLLDWFETVNYCDAQIVPRLPMDIVVYDEDTVVEAVKTHQYSGPFTIFRSSSTTAQIPAFSPSIWRKKDRSVHVLSKSGALCMVPRDAKTQIDTQVYDYPYIANHKELYAPDTDLDIIYISNGEVEAERWYEHLVRSVGNRAVKRVQNIPGRSEAYKAAAALSGTPWFFAVFAKLEVDPTFDWTWQPDFLQEPKHYIFNARNPVNGLVYGHQAILAYNKKLTLSTDDHGLDFTLSQKHEVVNMMSGVAHYNMDPWTTWRTAFRECIKLRNNADAESARRLEVWRTVAEGENADWSIRGANDAVAFYDSVSGDMNELLKTYEWKWLNDYYLASHKTDI